MSEWAINNGKTVAKNCDTGDYQIQIRHTSLNIIRLKNKLVRNYSFMEQVRKGKGQLKVTSPVMKMVVTLAVI